MQQFDPIAYINTPRWQASRLGLGRITRLLELMGRPQDKLRFVHVAGTNGKGSTCAFLESVLRHAGYKTGLFTSPYIEVFEERIRVGGKNIAHSDLAEVTLFVKKWAEVVEAETGDHPTEFELMTAVALEHFVRSGCDIVVLEVGLGGRLDSTNVISAPEVCVITRIGLDHTSLLGNTLAEVAAEKAGIVKAGVPVVSWPQDAEAARVVERVAAERGCPLHVPDFDALEVLPLDAALEVLPLDAALEVPPSDTVMVLDVSGSMDYDHHSCGMVDTQPVCLSENWAQNVSRETFVRQFAYKGQQYETRLLARYQPANAALAIEAVKVLRAKSWDISQQAVRAGIAAAEWPGRFEVAAHDPLTIIDGGHNPQGAEALAESLRELLSVPDASGAQACCGISAAKQAKAVFVMGVLADKDYRAMVRTVLPYASAVYAYTPPNNPRALSAEDLAATVREEAARVDGAFGFAQAVQVVDCESTGEALRRAREAAGRQGIVVAFGTLYAIADLKRALRSAP